MLLILKGNKTDSIFYSESCLLFIYSCYNYFELKRRCRVKKEFLKVEMMLPEYSHPDFQWGSLPGAIVSLLQNARPTSKTKVSGFYDHKGDMKNWKVVRSVLSSQKVQDKLQYRFKTSLTDEGMTFYAVGVKHEWEKTK